MSYANGVSATGRPIGAEGRDPLARRRRLAVVPPAFVREFCARLANPGPTSVQVPRRTSARAPTRPAAGRQAAIAVPGSPAALRAVAPALVREFCARRAIPGPTSVQVRGDTYRAGLGAQRGGDADGRRLMVEPPAIGLAMSAIHSTLPVPPDLAAGPDERAIRGGPIVVGSAGRTLRATLARRRKEIGDSSDRGRHQPVVRPHAALLALEQARLGEDA